MFGYGGYGMYYPIMDSTYIVYIVIPLLISMAASAMVNHMFKKYSGYENSRGYTAAQVARFILDRNGQADVAVEMVAGSLTDHYDPKARVIRLSDSVYSSRSVSAIGVAAHEAGHAAQHAQGYFPIKLRNAMVPAVNLAARLAVPLILVGALMELGGLVDAAIVLYSASVLFALVTLPVEFNASRRAITTLEKYEILDGSENAAAKKVLGAAAMTYVASLLAAIGSFLRILSIFGKRRD